MKDKDNACFHACLYAITKLTEKGSCRYSWKDSDGNWNSISWSEVCDWISEKLNAKSEVSENTRAEDTQQMPSEDAVSRQEVIDGINEYFHDKYYQRTSIQDCMDCLIRDVIKDLPPVTPTRKKGKWIVLKDEYGDAVEAVCSCCEDNGNHKWKYCHTCGAEMEYEDEAQSEDEK